MLVQTTAGSLELVLVLPHSVLIKSIVPIIFKSFGAVLLSLPSQATAQLQVPLASPHRAIVMFRCCGAGGWRIDFLFNLFTLHRRVSFLARWGAVCLELHSCVGLIGQGSIVYRAVVFNN